MDSGANLCLFNNKSLLEELTCLPFNRKEIRGANGIFKCFYKGSLSSKLDNLSSPKDNYYYSPDSTANILLLAMIAETN